MKGFKNSTKTCYYTGGPVKDGSRKDSEYGDYVLAAKRSQARAKGTPIPSKEPLVKTKK